VEVQTFITTGFANTGVENNTTIKIANTIPLTILPLKTLPFFTVLTIFNTLSNLSLNCFYY
jgi:hypothetical protein